MKTPITLGQMLSILSAIIIPLIVWGVSIETRFTEFGVRIQQNEKNYSSIKNDVMQIKETSYKILEKVGKLEYTKADKK